MVDMVVVEVVWFIKQRRSMVNDIMNMNLKSERWSGSANMEQRGHNQELMHVVT